MDQQAMRTSSPARRTLAGALLAALVGAAAVPAAHAVTVSPTALFIDARSPTGTLTLVNTGTLPEEIEISFAFGYPVTDAQGVVRVELVETAPAGEPAAHTWLRAFPRRLVLQPGQRQVIRILVEPPAGIADGEYWGRVLVRSRGGQPPIEQMQGDVRMQIGIETVFATALLFRKGEVRTGITVRAAEARVDGEQVEVLVDAARDGNAAFLGRFRAELLAPDGRVLGETEDAMAVYRDMRVRLTVPLAPGTPRAGLRVRYTVDTERPDLPANGLLRAEPVSGTVQVG